MFLYPQAQPRLSQFPKPNGSVIGDYERLLLPSKSVLGLIAKHGRPYYIKTDIEHYDDAILKALFMGNVRPPYISAESHCIGVFSLLVGLGGYNAFKLVDGATVSSKYARHKIRVNEMIESYSFCHHSAGPFGEDLLGDWLPADKFFSYLAIEGLGWKDIHASNVVELNPSAKAKPSARKFAELFAQLLIKPRLPTSTWKVVAKAYRRIH